jgi:hypothetical protein
MRDPVPELAIYVHSRQVAVRLTVNHHGAKDLFDSDFALALNFDVSRFGDSTD